MKTLIKLTVIYAVAYAAAYFIASVVILGMIKLTKLGK